MTFGEPGPSSSTYRAQPPPQLAKSISQYETQHSTGGGGNASSFANALYEGEEDEDAVDGCLTPDPEDEDNRPRFRRGWAASSTSGGGRGQPVFNRGSTRSSESVLSKYRNALTSRTSSHRSKSEQYLAEHPNRPSGARWRQQTLPAWQPIYRPLNVIATFLGFGLLLTALGVLMLLSSLRTAEVVVDYTDCTSLQFTPRTCAQVLEEALHAPALPQCTCSVPVTVPADMATPVYLYYSLDGFYQNHRRYVKSVDDSQLAGKEVARAKLIDNCKPFATLDGDENGPIYAPCGAIANSLFSDAFTLRHGSSAIHLHQADISWSSDRRSKFHNPGSWEGTIHPRNWTVDALQLGPPEAGNGYENEHLIVWMRTAAFPSFRKLWARIDPGSLWSRTDVLKAGEYLIDVEYNYRTVLGKLRIPKTLIISNTSWMGGRNLFMPILYIVVGGLSIITGVVFLVIVWRTKRRGTGAFQRIRPGVGVQPNYQTMSPPSSSSTNGGQKNEAAFGSTSPLARSPASDDED